MQKFKFLPHTADMKFQAFGKTIEECFENAGYALVSIMTSDKIKLAVKKEILVSGKDYESLLYNFLEEFLFLMDSESLVIGKISKIEIHRSNGRYELTSEVYGDNIKKYKSATDIKAITYNDMFIRKEKNKFICQVVVDV